jgi:hypothetical protein
MSKQNEFTHIISLWLHNEYDLYRQWTEATATQYKGLLQGGAGGDADTLVRIRIADAMNEEFEDWWENMVANERKLGGFWSDLMRRALWQADWLDLAQEFIDAHKESCPA